MGALAAREQVPAVDHLHGAHPGGPWRWGVGRLLRLGAARSGRAEDRAWTRSWCSGWRPCFFYVVHIPMVTFAAVWSGGEARQHGLQVTAWVTVTICVVLYPLCRWYGSYKAGPPGRLGPLHLGAGRRAHALAKRRWCILQPTALQVRADASHVLSSLVIFSQCCKPLLLLTRQMLHHTTRSFHPFVKNKYPVWGHETSCSLLSWPRPPLALECRVTRRKEDFQDFRNPRI